MLTLATSSHCSLRCDYCAASMNYPKVQTRKAYLDEIGPEAYLAALQPALRRWGPLVVSFCGPGEPLESEHFGSMMRKLLADGHRVRIYTNALHASVLQNLIATTNPTDHERIEIAASYHVTTFSDTQRDQLRSNVFATLLALGTTGAHLRVMIPMAPPALFDPDLEDDLDFLVAYATEPPTISLIDLGHRYRGKPYPASYTPAELSRLGELLSRYGQWRPVPRDIQLLRKTGPLKLRGKPCWAPAHEVTVGLDGSIWHCSPGRAFARGRLDDYSAADLYEPGPVACPFETCRCKTLGISHCLEPRGVTLEDHFRL